MRVLLLATCATALRYDAAQLQAWWNASAAGPGDDCPPEDACRRPVAPARVALLLRGESFRASAAQHTRDTCTEKSLAAQARVTATHYRLMEWMAGLGFGVDVYGLTRPCHGGGGANLAGAALLAKSYARWLRAPVGVIGHRAPAWGPTSSLQAQKQFRRVLVMMMLAGRDRYSYVLMTRFDIAYVGTPPRCLLAGAASYSARSLRAPFANQDFLQLVAGRHVCRWVCAVARSNGCGWDGCMVGLPSNSTCGERVPKHGLAQKPPDSWWSREFQSEGLPTPLAFDAAPAKDGVVAAFMDP